MRIAVLTSSRADYGIYLPLLKSLRHDESIDLSIIAFGTHCKLQFGRTIDQIRADGFEVKYEIDNLLEGDAPHDIAKSFSNTIHLFTDFWNVNQDNFDCVLCLGDRFEMAAAVIASIPYQIKMAHLHAGETTLGAIDNIYRHQISLTAQMHLVSLPLYAERIEEIIGNSGTSTVIGSLSLLNLNDIELLDNQAFHDKWGIDLNIPTALVTVHPETVQFTRNEQYAKEVRAALKSISKEFQIVITMPNADTFGSVYRTAFINLQTELTNVFLIENFGTQSYFSCMKHASFLLGNTSSGIIEAASFNKFVINIGDRQKGRYTSENVITVPFETESILNAIDKIKGKQYEGDNPYFRADSIELILNKLKASNT